MVDKDSRLNVLDSFPLQTYDKIRYADTDRQGHVNNAMFSTFLETGRVEFMSDTKKGMLADNCEFVIANSNLNLLGEINWPGNVDIGTQVIKVGNSSVCLFQRLFQDDRCVASAETVIVQMNETTRKSQPLSDYARSVFIQYQSADHT